MSRRDSEVVITLPAGRYYIGDPCYVIPDSKWDDFCTVMFQTSDYHVVEFEGKPLLAGSTAYGDGCYNDQYGNQYGVDAGTLSVVPESLWNPTMSNDQVAQMGTIVVFEEPFRASCCNGFFQFGHIVINTDDDVEDDVDVD